MPRRQAVAQDAAVRIEGIPELQRYFRKVAPAVSKGLTAQLRAIAQTTVLPRARANAPRDTGRLAGSIRAGANLKGAYIRSNLPYAPVHEFGGTIRPRGAPISIRQSRFMRGAVDENRQLIVDRVEGAVERTLLSLQPGR